MRAPGQHAPVGLFLGDSWKIDWDDWEQDSSKLGNVGSRYDVASAHARIPA